MCPGGRAPLLGERVDHINPATIEEKAYDEVMDYILQRLSDLRQEITDLRSMNARYLQRNEHDPVEQSACEHRANRLLQIKKELSNMKNLPREGAVWWERLKVAPVRLT